MTSSVASSAQWTSSITSTTGRRGSSSTASTASRTAPVSARATASANGPPARRATSWSGPRVRPVMKSSHQPTSVRTSSWARESSQLATSVDLPMPASPPTSTTAPAPARARSSTSSSVASSTSRSRTRSVAVGNGMTGSGFRHRSRGCPRATLGRCRSEAKSRRPSVSVVRRGAGHADRLCRAVRPAGTLPRVTRERGPGLRAAGRPGGRRRDRLHR